jgi:hypothetical protein
VVGQVVFEQHNPKNRKETQDANRKQTENKLLGVMPDTEPLRDETEEEEAAEANKSQSDDQHWKAPIVVCRSVIDLGFHGRHGNLGERCLDGRMAA